MEVVDNFTLADSVIGKHFLSIRLQPVEKNFHILEQRTRSRELNHYGCIIWLLAHSLPPPPLFKDNKIFYDHTNLFHIVIVPELPAPQAEHASRILFRYNNKWDERCGPAQAENSRRRI